MAKEIKHPELIQAVVRIQETGRTIRWCVVGAVIVFSVWIISDAIVRALEQPPWLTLTIVLVTTLLAPSGLVMLLVKKIRRYTKTDHQRLIELEKELDADRESSGLKEDGTDPS